MAIDLNPLQQVAGRLGKSFHEVFEAFATAGGKSEALDDALPQLNVRGDKPIPNRKRRFHGNAIRRADRRYTGAQKMLRLLEPAGVQSGPEAMSVLAQRFGL